MKKPLFNILVLLIIAIFLILLNEMDLLEKGANFMFIPILAFYFLGQYSERRFQK